MALDWAQRAAEKIDHLVIAHLVEIAIAKADCPETNWLPQQMASPKAASVSGTARTNQTGRPAGDPHRCVGANAGIDEIVLHPPISTVWTALAIACR